MNSIEVDHLSKAYRHGALVLDDATFRFEGHGAVGFLGPNGAGKSTTMKLLVGLLRPTRGFARLNGIDPMHDRGGALWDVGSVIENPEAYPSETIFDALNRVGTLRGLDREGIDHDIDRCLEELDLPPLEQRCGWLSKGQRQRVALAAARMGDPKVLLLDEPTDGMDPAMRARVRDRLCEVRKDHLILMSSHLMADVTEICDQLVFIDHGNILLKGSTDSVSQRTDYRLVEIEFERPVPDDGLAPIRPLVEEVVRSGPGRFRLRFDGQVETRTRLLEAALRVAPVRSFTRAHPALEDAYLEVIGASAPR